MTSKEATSSGRRRRRRNPRATAAAAAPHPAGGHRAPAPLLRPVGGGLLAALPLVDHHHGHHHLDLGGRSLRRLPAKNRRNLVEKARQKSRCYSLHDDQPVDPLAHIELLCCALGPARSGASDKRNTRSRSAPSELDRKSTRLNSSHLGI